MSLPWLQVHAPRAAPSDDETGWHHHCCHGYIHTSPFLTSDEIVLHMNMAESNLCAILLYVLHHRKLQYLLQLVGSTNCVSKKPSIISIYLCRYSGADTGWHGETWSHCHRHWYTPPFSLSQSIQTLILFPEFCITFFTPRNKLEFYYCLPKLFIFCELEFAVLLLLPSKTAEEAITWNIIVL